MRIEDILDSDIKAKLGVLRTDKRKAYPKRKNTKKRKQKPLSEREIKELMGQYQPTYKRVNGKVKRR